MAINITITNVTNARTQSLSFDFIGDIMGDDWSNVNPEYDFKVTTSARDINGVLLPTKLIKGLNVATDSLVLNGQKQSRSNTAVAYTNIRDMIEDYIYDYINGHTANQYGSGCTAQAAMRFT